MFYLCYILEFFTDGFVNSSFYEKNNLSESDINVLLILLLNLVIDLFLYG